MTDSLEHDVALSIHAYYCGELDAGRRASERILARDDLSAEVDVMARTNRLWYGRLLSDLCPVVCHKITVQPAHEGWSTFNPSLLFFDDQLWCLVRSSNYEIVNGRYVMPPGDTTIRTENILCRMSPDTLEASQRRVIEKPDYQATGYEVTGLEDCRLRETATGVGVSCTVRDVAPFDGRCRIATADLDLDTATMSSLVVLDSLSTQEHEKNWMPIVGSQSWLYSCRHQGRVVTVDPDPQLPDAYTMHGRGRAAAVCRGFRGGGQVVPVPGGYLAIVHECAFLGHQRAYEHRFVFFDNDFSITRVSPVFSFRELRTIEFAAGLAVVGDHVFVSFGHRDKTAWVCKIPYLFLREILQPLSLDTCG